MKRNFDVVLCVRGRGCFEAGCAYAMYKTGRTTAVIHVQSKHIFIRTCYASYHSRVSPRGSWYEINNIASQEENGARFVEVKKCKRKVKKHG